MASSTSANPVTTPPNDHSLKLKEILKRPSPVTLSPDETALLFTACASPRIPLRSLAIGVLSRLLAPTARSSTSPETALKSGIASRLSGTDSAELTEGLSMLSALLQVTPGVGVSILLDEGVQSQLVEVVEYVTAPLSSTAKAAKEKAGLRKKAEQLALVELLSLAAGQSGVRAMVRKSAGAWLESLLGRLEVEKGREDVRIRSLAAVGVVKIRLGKEKPEEGGSTTTTATESKIEEIPDAVWSLESLVDLFSEMLVVCSTAISPNGAEEKADSTAETDELVIVSALEGLAYLTLVPDSSLKSRFLTRPNLSALYSLLPSTRWSTPSALEYGIASLMSNLTSYPPPQTATNATLSRLKSFASAQAPPTPTEASSSVDQRITFFLSASLPSPIPTLQILARSSSLGVRRLAAKIYHSLCTPPPLRPKLLQSGVQKSLLTLIRNLPTPFRVQDTESIQALAKLLITTEPRLVLSEKGELIDGLLAMTVPLGGAVAESGGDADEEVALLTKFECLLALTNISSGNNEMADRIAGIKILRTQATPDEIETKEENKQGKPLLRILEELMLCGNELVCRASTELICNLLNGSDLAIAYYLPLPSPSAAPNDPALSEPPKPNSHLHLLIALASSPDVPTRLAASGALASLAVCKNTEIEYTLACYKRGMEIILALLEQEEGVALDQKIGLRHRGWELLRCIFEGVAEGKNETRRREVAREVAQEVGLVAKMKEALGRENDDFLKELAGMAMKGVQTALIEE